MKAWARRAQKVCDFLFMLTRCLLTNTLQKYAASTTSHVRLVNLLTKNPRRLPRTRTANPTPAELNLPTAVATSTITLRATAITTTQTLHTRTLLAKASKRRESPARMPMREFPRKRPPRRNETRREQSYSFHPYPLSCIGSSLAAVISVPIIWGQSHLCRRL